MIGSIAAAVLLLLYAMRPFAQLRRALAQVRTGDSSAIKGIFPEEVQPLIDDLNNLLASSGEQMVRARTQAGNIAHGLKSSLAATGDIRKVALWLGHASIQSTEAYLRADPAEKLAVLAAHSPPTIKPGKFRPPSDVLLAALGEIRNAT